MAQAGRGAGLTPRARRTQRAEARLGVAGTRLRAPAGAGLCALAALACMPTPVDVASLTARHPELAALRGHRLADLRPYVLPVAGELIAFTCRWPDGQEVGVALPQQGEPEVLHALEAAVAAWDAAGLGIRLAREPEGQAEIAVELAPEHVATPGGSGVGATRADCAVEVGALAGRSDPLPARLVSAHVRIARRTPETQGGYSRKLSPAEIAGVTAHELGHALGFQGHPPLGDTAMVRGDERAAALGRGLLAEPPVPLSDATLRALYVLPSGRVLRRSPVSTARTEPFDRLAELAGARGLAGPFVRVGDFEARIFFRDRASGETLAVETAGLSRALVDPERLVLLPDAAARRALAGS